MVHANHGNIHEIGLQDDCPACEEHAASPWSSLDSSMLRDLIKRNFFYRFGDDYWINENGERVPRDRSAYAPRNDTEAHAMAQITNVMERMGRLMEFDSENLIQSYLERRWRIDFKER